MRSDLHLHSTASDGTLSPSRIVELAAEAGLTTIALTDHDSVEGVAPALQSGQRHGVEVIPAVEFSAWREGLDAHILGYYIDHTDAALTETLLEFRHARLERALAMIESLTDAGFDISAEDVLQLADGGSVGRSHIARALVNGGHVASVRDAFERLIGREKPHYVRKPLATPEEVVELVRTYGGIPVLAHPGVNRADELVSSLCDAGLAGIEAYHYEHTDEQTRELESLAESRELLVTGGSDYHGPGSPGPGLGGVPVPPDVVPRLKAAAGRS